MCEPRARDFHSCAARNFTLSTRHRTSPPVTAMASSIPKFAFLSQPLDSWIGALVYIAGWIVLLWIVAFIGRKYWEIFSANTSQAADTVVLDPRYRRRFMPRTPFPSASNLGSSPQRSPLSQVSSASDLPSNYQPRISTYDQESHAQRQRRFDIARWSLTPGWISVGAVDEGQIAKRRRARSSH